MSTKIVQTPAVALYSGMSTSITTMRVTPYPLDLDGNKLVMGDWGSIGYATIDPGISSYEEIVSFTGITDNGDNTATFTGLTRDLEGKSDYTAGSSGKTHGSSAVVVFSNNPQIYNLYGALANDQTWAGINTFSRAIPVRTGGTTTSTTPTPNVDTTSNYFLTAQVSNMTWGAPTGTPGDKQILVLQVLANSIYTIAFNAAYSNGGVPLPTATVANKLLTIVLQWNAYSSLWLCMAVMQQT